MAKWCQKWLPGIRNTLPLFHTRCFRSATQAESVIKCDAEISFILSAASLRQALCHKQRLVGIRDDALHARMVLSTCALIDAFNNAIEAGRHWFQTEIVFD